MSTSRNQPARTFSGLVGSNSRSELLEYLATTDGPTRQFEIAEALDLSQASVSRSAAILIESGIITRDETGGLRLADDDIQESIITIHNSVSGESV